MFKNLKLLFSFLLFLLFFFPSFFFLPSPSYSSLAASDSRSYPSDSWTSKQRQATLFALQKYGKGWLTIVAFGLKKIKYKTKVGQDVIFHFDKLAAAFQPEILKQREVPVNLGFDFTKIQGEAQKQFLQPYQPGTANFVDGFYNAIDPRINEYANSFLDSLRPTLLKMKTLGLFKIDVSYMSQYDISVQPIDQTNLEKISYEEFSSIGWGKLQYFALLTLSPTPNNAKNVLDKAINKVWTPWLHTLQNANGFGLTHLTVDKVSIDVSSLVNSKVQEASKLSLEQIQILKKLKSLGFKTFQTQTQAWIDPYLISYKTNIQPTLKNFANTKIKKIKINNTLYQIDLLLKESNLKLTGSQLPQLAKTQLLALAKVKITPQVLENALQDAKLEIYHLTIVDNLNALRENNISQITINDKTYPLTELIKPVNKNKTVSLLSIPAKTELTTLAKNAITKTQLDTALNTVLTSREETAKKAKAKTLQAQKKSKQKKLIIGLSVGGSALVLSSFGGFLYWFFKIKK